MTADKERDHDYQPPPGFEAITMPPGFNKALEPVYSKRSDKQIEFGFIVTPGHCNSSGRCHGGALMTFADVALGASVSVSLGQFASTPTINLSMDFVSAAEIGDWIVADCRVLRTTRSMGFADAVILAGDRLVARASGIFKLPS
jgi:uncharacterized protein (TIGR00369 family)